MKSPVIEDIDGIGKVLFEQSRKAKRIILSVRINTGIRIAVPVGVSFKRAKAFVLSKEEWIKEQQKKMKILKQKQSEMEIPPLLMNKEDIKRLLNERLIELARKHGFSFNRLFIRNQKTRWGSCSAKNNINLNENLVRLPDDLMNYVLLHELVHTKIKNHSPQFWKELDTILGNAKQFQSRLKEYGIWLSF